MDDRNFFNFPKVERELPNTVEGCHDLIHSLLGTISELFKRVEKIEIEKREPNKSSGFDKFLFFGFILNTPNFASF